MTRAYALALAAVLGAASAPAAGAGAPCAGFADVDSADVFCPSVEWMKNRAVTTGCTPGFYCPDPDVSRLAMAAFMQRLGRTLSPLLRYAEDAGATLDPDAGDVVCATTGKRRPRSGEPGSTSSNKIDEPESAATTSSKLRGASGPSKRKYTTGMVGNPRASWALSTKPSTIPTALGFG